MNYLLDDKLAPTTSEIGFLECDCANSVSAFVRWQSTIFAPHGVSVSAVSAQAQDLETSLRRLFPLTTVQARRYVFVPTRGTWTAFFDNGASGTNAMPAMSYLARELGCRSLRVCSVADTKGKERGARGRYGATILEVYGPKDGYFLNYVRSLAAANDGGTWRFVEAGNAFPFEDVTVYSARSIRDRFTHDTLSHYVSSLGVRAFEESFYVPDGAVLVAKIGPPPANQRELSLEEARAKF